ncbi:chitin binding peritrophin-A domain-containing protein [Chitinophaga solisilvae]|uniref:Chitin binding domain-containing protein n=1 Tax=Chitinophaga solisilvae TaxID=1233460 RepID=A0A3S1B304_9BACT|nr:chitin binding peritrophin-A domain-containing protein [Chitinophaga solisilvae]NSL88671.1 chitin binding domain-containing protein [Chitinophaga solisilvae]
MVKRLILAAVLAMGAYVSHASVVGTCANQGQYLSDSKDCTIYYECDAALVPVKRHCGPGLEWDCIRQMCTYPSIVPDGCPCK